MGGAARPNDSTSEGACSSAADELDFRRLVDAVTDYAIFLLDADGIVRSWNAGAQRIKGWTADEVIGRHFSIFYPDGDRGNKPLTHLERAAADGHVEDEGWRLRRDGSKFWAQVTITALRDDDGSIRGFAKITRDLSDRKQAEESARRLALLEEHEAIGSEILARTVTALFGIGLGLQGVLMEIDDKRVQGQLEEAINDLDAVISEVRKAVYRRMARV